MEQEYQVKYLGVCAKLLLKWILKQQDERLQIGFSQNKHKQSVAVKTVMTFWVP